MDDKPHSHRHPTDGVEVPLLYIIDWTFNRWLLRPKVWDEAESALRSAGGF